MVRSKKINQYTSGCMCNQSIGGVVKMEFAVNGMLFKIHCICIIFSRWKLYFLRLFVQSGRILVVCMANTNREQIFQCRWIWKDSIIQWRKTASSWHRFKKIRWRNEFYRTWWGRGYKILRPFLEEGEADPPRRFFDGIGFLDCCFCHHRPVSKTSLPTRPKMVWQEHNVWNPARIFPGFKF